MKKLILAAIAAIAFAGTASAQFVSGGSSKSSYGSSDSYNSVYAFYAPTNLVTSASGFNNSLSMKSVGVGFTRTTGIASVANLIYEFGAAAQYSWDNDIEDTLFGYMYDVEGNTKNCKLEFFSLKVPVSLLYNIQLADNIAILPYGGLDPTLFIVGKVVNGSDSIDLFKSQHWEDADYEYDMESLGRFELNWHIGAKIMLNDKYYAGVKYEAPITSLYNKDGGKINYNMTQLSLGLIF